MEWKCKINNLACGLGLDTETLENCGCMSLKVSELTEPLTSSLTAIRFAITGLRNSHNQTRNKLEQFVILESISKLLQVKTNINMILAEDDDE